MHELYFLIVFQIIKNNFRLWLEKLQIIDFALSGLRLMLFFVHWASPNAFDFALSGL